MVKDNLPRNTSLYTQLYSSSGSLTILFCFFKHSRLSDESIGFSKSFIKTLAWILNLHTRHDATLEKIIQDGDSYPFLSKNLTIAWLVYWIEWKSIIFLSSFQLIYKVKICMCYQCETCEKNYIPSNLCYTMISYSSNLCLFEMLRRGIIFFLLIWVSSDGEN